MQVSIEKTSGLERRMKVQVPAERVEREVEERLRSLGKRAKLNGFRPGKIPFDVVRKRFGEQVRSEVVTDLLQSSCNDAFVQEKLSPAGGPRIDSVNNAPGKDLEFTAVFEVYPEFKLQGLEGIKLERPVAEVQESDIDAMLENLRTQRADWETVEHAAARGDRVQVDFDGSIDGQPFAGGKAEQTLVEIGANRMLEDFENGIIGISAGEEREFDVHFPDDYQSSEVAGKTARFKVKAHRVEARKLPELDDEFCKSFGITEGGIAELRSEVSDNMRHEMADTIRRKLKDQVLDALLKANSLDLPGSMVDDEIERLKRDALARMGIRDEKKASELPRDLFEEQARRRVSLGLIVGEIINDQQLRVDERQVEQRLERMATDYSNPGEALRSLRSNASAMRQLESVVLEDQAVEWLIARAEVTDKPATFKELMHFDEHDHQH
ncbi:MAG TPA: trigger factor [Steroidobacteraceae bacterium]|nr:trigger factor [Steroidobacteraceae bacterium]